MLNALKGFKKDSEDEENKKTYFPKFGSNDGSIKLLEKAYRGFKDTSREYQSPFTTIPKQGWSYNGNKLTSEAQRKRRADIGFEISENFKKPQQQSVVPQYPSIMELYKR